MSFNFRPTKRFIIFAPLAIVSVLAIGILDLQILNYHKSDTAIKQPSGSSTNSSKEAKATTPIVITGTASPTISMASSTPTVTSATPAPRIATPAANEATTPLEPVVISQPPVPQVEIPTTTPSTPPVDLPIVKDIVKNLQDIIVL